MEIIQGFAFLFLMGACICLLPGLLLGGLLVAVDAAMGWHRTLPEIINDRVAARTRRDMLGSLRLDPAWSRADREMTRQFLDWFVQSVLAEYAVGKNAETEAARG